MTTAHAQTCADTSAVFSLIMNEIISTEVFPKTEKLHIGRETVDFSKSSVVDNYSYALEKSLTTTLNDEEMKYLKSEINNPRITNVPSNLVKTRPNTYFIATDKNYSAVYAYENAKTWTVYFSTPVFIKDYCIIGTGLYFYGKKDVTTEAPIIEFTYGGYMHEFCLFLQKENGLWKIKSWLLQSIT